MAVPGLLSSLARNQYFRTYVGRPCIEASTWLWSYIPDTARKTKPAQRYGRWLHNLVHLRDRGYRRQNPGTYFLRNRAELEFVGQLAATVPMGGQLRIAVLGCSTGAEAFSMSWAVLDKRRDIDLAVHASDISATSVETARAAVYPADFVAITGREAPGLDETEKAQLLETLADGSYRVRDDWRAPITWHLLDAMHPDVVERIGLQDVVVANRFLCHMEPGVARRCLRNVIRLVKPGGHLLVTGVDLDVRSQEIRAAGLIPVMDGIEDRHEGDPTLRIGWPLNYWGLEPLDKNRPDWPFRYGIAFRKPAD